jgi:catechol 2,3-dioxygenase-like lactoylglutathione lyase family enzyme
MKQSLLHVTLVVRDYDEALEFFVTKLKFTVVEDRFIPEQNKRWVLVAPRGSTGSNLLLAKASTDEQRSAVGNQTGGRVAFFLGTDDFCRDFNDMCAAGVRFVREPKTEPHGTVAVFEDLYGNRWDLLGSAAGSKRHGP